ncbi:hypothetical protein, partial [Methanothrix sp.]|uniref:hypothetical protein n=1 Tax=Methanothrix sp. TaxID=90426 RepID=UPI0032969F80
TAFLPALKSGASSLCLCDEGRLFMAEMWLQPSAYGDIDYFGYIFRAVLFRAFSFRVCTMSINI